ncbi:MAG: glycosyltransferase family 47 protein [Simkaniaceae bacterium]|nr:glycosyltransferase family 47 protein [Simkaniaceae bacterium]
MKVLWVSYPQKHYFQADWIEYLLSDFNTQVSFDPDLKHLENGCLLIFSENLKNEHIALIKKFAHDGKKFGLVHIGDEAYRANIEIYQYASFVFREYYSQKIAQIYRHVFFLPLGSKRGFILNKACHELPKISDRPYLWSFMGQVTKSSRKSMIAHLKQLKAQSFCHFNHSFNSQDCLSTETYQHVLKNTIFSPCPRGWINLDSFRLYESLESGCIPIVERGRDAYFLNAFKNPPFLIVRSWKEARNAIKNLQNDPEEIEKLRLRCFNWWIEEKRQLKKSIHDQIRKIQ